MSDLQHIFTTALSLHQQGKFEQAEREYLKVLAKLPGNLSVLGNLGIVCRDLGKLEKAETYCRQAVAAAPADPAQLLNLGAVLEAQEEYDQALSCYEQALALDPAHPKALNNLGKLLHLRGDSDRGLQLVRKAVATEPRYPLALNNLGVILSERGDLAAASEYLERSLALEPDNPDTLFNLSGLCNCLGQSERAQQLLRRLLELEPEHVSAEHLLAALEGRVTGSAPQRYVSHTFDRYAGRFDRHIRESLGYTAPEVLREMVAEQTSAARFQRGLDLGCGTGLSGQAFREAVDHLTGIDVSAGMLEKAAMKKIYDHLENIDIATFLARETAVYDLFIAADVMVYIGDLEPFFAALAGRAAAGALLVCSIERHEIDGDYTLRPSGRYAHGCNYLTARAAAAGFTIVSRQQHNIRKEHGAWIPGELVICRYNPN